jgi:hypothetical protein
MTCWDGPSSIVQYVICFVYFRSLLCEPKLNNYHYIARTPTRISYTIICVTEVITKWWISEGNIILVILCAGTAIQSHYLRRSESCQVLNRGIQSPVYINIYSDRMPRVSIPTVSQDITQLTGEYNIIVNCVCVTNSWNGGVSISCVERRTVIGGSNTV